MVVLDTFLRMDSHLVESLDEGSDIDFHGYDFSLIFLESLVYSLCHLQVGIDGIQFSL